jgi:hypothetical protein
MIKTWMAVVLALATMFMGTLGGLFWGAIGGGAVAGAVGGIAGVSAGAVVGACVTTKIARQKGLLNDAQTLEVLNEFKDQAIKEIRKIPYVEISDDKPLEISDLDCKSVIDDLK